MVNLLYMYIVIQRGKKIKNPPKAGKWEKEVIFFFFLVYVIVCHAFEIKNIR